MTTITLDRETADRLLEQPADGPVELRFPDGRKIGEFMPDPKAYFTPEEWDRIRESRQAPGTTRTHAEVWASIHAAVTGPEGRLGA